MARGQGIRQAQVAAATRRQPQEPAPSPKLSRFPPPSPPGKVRVSLSNGPAQGWLVDVDGFPEEIAVYRAARGGFLAGSMDNANGALGEFVGVYGFVGPYGPGRPSYVFLRRTLDQAA